MDPVPTPALGGSTTAGDTSAEPLLVAQWTELLVELVIPSGGDEYRRLVFIFRECKPARLDCRRGMDEDKEASPADVALADDSTLHASTA